MNEKIITTILSIFVLTAILTTPALAVTESSGNITVTYDEPLFDSSVVWYPGRTESRTITVSNNDSQTRDVGLQATGTSQTGGFAELLLFEVTEGGSTVYGGGSTTMKDFWDDGEVSLSSLTPGATTTYTVIITMPQTAGNEYQNVTAGFDMIVGLIGTDSQVPVNNGSTGGDGGGGDGSSSGGGGGDGGATSTPGTILGAATGPFFSNILGVTTIEDEDEPEEDEQGENEEITENGEVAAAEDCQNKPWWRYVIIGFIIGQIIIIVFRKRLPSQAPLLLQILNVGIASILLYLALCNPLWWIIGAILVGLVIHATFTSHLD